MDHVTVPTTIHIFVDLDRNTQKKLEFDTDHVTGRQIKEKAEVPLDVDLALRVEGKPQLVTNDQVITIKNGQHFIIMPPGTVS